MGEHKLSSYRKKFVDAYICDMEEQNAKAISERDDLIESLKAKNTELVDLFNELQQKYTVLSAETQELQKEKGQVADVLMNAETTAAAIIDRAKETALKEKLELEAQSELLRQEIEQRNKVISDMKEQTAGVCCQMRRSIDEIYNNFTAGYVGVRVVVGPFDIWTFGHLFIS